MRVRGVEQALSDVDRIGEHIRRDNPAAADRVTRLIASRINLLQEHPEAGRVGRVEGARELVIWGTSYVAAYRVRHREVEIIAVIHAARQWPRRF